MDNRHIAMAETNTRNDNPHYGMTETNTRDDKPIMAWLKQTCLMNMTCGAQPGGK